MQTILNAISIELMSQSGAAPDWLHLTPAGVFTGADGRGPFVVENHNALISQSIKSGRKLPIDINHSTDIRGPKGEETPAVGWIVEMQARADGVWGRVEWTDRGKQIMAAREYGYLSPVLMVAKGTSTPKRVASIARVSLTNDPNLPQLAALHTRQSTGEYPMEKELREALGLPETADATAIVDAVKTMHQASTSAKALHAQLAQAVGLTDAATGEQLVAALQTRKSGDDGEVNDLRNQVKELNTRLTATVTAAAQEKAQATIDKAVEDGRIVPALRDHYISRHVRNPKEVEDEIKLLPSLHSGGLGQRRDVGDGASLSAVEADICEKMGLDPKKFAETSKTIKEVL